MFSTPVCFRVPTPKRGRVFIISTDSLASWRLPPCFFLLFCSAQAPCALVVVFFQFTARTIILPLVQCQSNSVKSSSPDPKKLSGVCTRVLKCAWSHFVTLYVLYPYMNFLIAQHKHERHGVGLLCMHFFTQKKCVQNFTSQ